MHRLKVAIVGAGTLVRRFHFPTFMANPGVEIVAICDPDIDRAKDLAARAAGAKAYASLDEALASHRPDIASICSPRSTIERRREPPSARGHFDLAFRTPKQG